MKKYFFIFFLFLIVSSLVSADLNECKGTMEQENVPCYIFLPTNTSQTNCSSIIVRFQNITTLVYALNMSEYNNFTCNATYNISPLGTFTFLYSTGDTGSITNEVGTLNFFNLTVFLVFMAIGFLFLVFMHVFKDNKANSIVYGWFATSFFVIIGSMIVSPNFNVVRGVTFLIDVDYYIAILAFVLAIFSAYTSIALKKQFFTEADSESA